MVWLAEREAEGENVRPSVGDPLRVRDGDHVGVQDGDEVPEVLGEALWVGAQRPTHTFVGWYKESLKQTRQPSTI